MCFPSLFFSHKTGRNRGQTEMLAAAGFSMKNEQHAYGRQLESSAHCRARDSTAPSKPHWLFPSFSGALGLTLALLHCCTCGNGASQPNLERPEAAPDGHQQPVLLNGSASPAVLACPGAFREVVAWLEWAMRTHKIIDHSCCQQQMKPYPQFIDEGLALVRAVKRAQHRAAAQPQPHRLSISASTNNCRSSSRACSALHGTFQCHRDKICSNLPKNAWSFLCRG